MGRISSVRFNNFHRYRVSKSTPDGAAGIQKFIESFGSRISLEETGRAPYYL